MALYMAHFPCVGYLQLSQQSLFFLEFKSLKRIPSRFLLLLFSSTGLLDYIFNNYRYKDFVLAYVMDNFYIFIFILRAFLNLFCVLMVYFNWSEKFGQENMYSFICSFNEATIYWVLGRQSCVKKNIWPFPSKRSV